MYSYCPFTYTYCIMHLYSPCTYTYCIIQVLYIHNTHTAFIQLLYAYTYWFHTALVLTQYTYCIHTALVLTHTDFIQLLCLYILQTYSPCTYKYVRHTWTLDTCCIAPFYCINTILSINILHTYSLFIYMPSHTT